MPVEIDADTNDMGACSYSRSDYRYSKNLDQIVRLCYLTATGVCVSNRCSSYLSIFTSNFFPHEIGDKREASPSQMTKCIHLHNISDTSAEQLVG